jgi:cysteine desulfurase
MAPFTAQEIYLGHDATTQPLPQVRESVLLVLDSDFGIHSIAHLAGYRTLHYLSRTRGSLANLLGANPSQLIFTNGGTESNNAALSSVLNGKA